MESRKYDILALADAAIRTAILMRDAHMVGLYLIQTTVDKPILASHSWWIFHICLLRISSFDLTIDLYFLSQILAASQCFYILST